MVGSRLMFLERNRLGLDECASEGKSNVDFALLSWSMFAKDVMAIFRFRMAHKGCCKRPHTSSHTISTSLRSAVAI